MKNFLTLALVATGLVLGSMATTVQADEHQHVRFTTYGQDRSLHLTSHSAAHQLTNKLRSLGCSAHVHHDADCYEVHYSSRGGSRTFDCDYDAHRFADWMRSLGFTVSIVHH